MAAVLALLFSAGATTAAAAIYKYQRPDGTWVFTDSSDQLPAGAKTVQPSGTPVPTGSRRDLAVELADAVRPRNPVERAAMATVAIESGVGQGSGFFINDEGLILTNRHVIRTSEQEHKQRNATSESFDRQATTIAASLNEESRRWQEAVAELESYRGRIDADSYDLNRRKLERWQQDLQRRQEELHGKTADFRSRQEEAEARARRNDLERVFTVRLADGTRMKAFYVAADEKLDLALLKIDGVRTPWLKPSPMGKTQVGHPVFAIGNPAALHNSVARGIFSGYEGGLLKTDAKIYPGNSGGPLVTESGEVMGVNSFKRLTERFEGLGFAVPVQAALHTFARYLSSAR